MDISQKEQLKKLFNTNPSKYKSSPSQEIRGLYIAGTRNSIPLKSIVYDVEIIDSLAFISLTQNYFNSSANTIETEYFFSILDNACFYEFQAEIDGQIMIGQIKEKQEAKAEYEQNKAQGNTVAYAEVNKEAQDIVKINIGNVPANKTIQIKFSFLQELNIYLNKFWKLLIPATLTPRYVSLQGDVKNNNQAEVDQYQNFNFPQSKEGYDWTINIVLNSMTEISFIRSPSHEISIEELDKLHCQFKIQFKNKENPNKDFTLLFANKSINETRVTLAKNIMNDEKEENPYCAMINFMPDFNHSSDEDAYKAFKENSVKTNYEINLMKAKGEYIFLLDRSGSMSGQRIEMANKALKLFLKSLPPDSYFNIIGFGSNYESFYEASKKTDENVLETALKRIINTDADLGGTEIYNPLKFALLTPKINKYPKNVFILTDGGVSNVNSILALIAEHNDFSRIYTIGVGNGCSRDIIVEGAKIGKGKHEFIAENEDMNDKIVGLLEDSITPFLTDFKMSYDKELINIITPLPESIDFIRKNEELRMFCFLNHGFQEKKHTELKFEYYDSTLDQKIMKTLTIEINDLMIEKDYLHKYGTFHMIKRIGRGLTYDRNYDSDVYLAKKDNLETFCLNMALKHQILTPFTSFICVMKQIKSEQNLEEPVKIIIPCIESIDHQVEEMDMSYRVNSLGQPKYRSANRSFQACNVSFMQMRTLDELTTQSKNLCSTSREFQKKSKPNSNINIFSKMLSSVSNLFKKEEKTDSFNTQAVEKALIHVKVKEQGKKQEKLSLMKLLENQKLEGYWEMNEQNSKQLAKELRKIKDSIPEIFSQKDKNHAEILWMTSLVLFYLETFQKEKTGSWKLIGKKADQWISSKGFDYQENCKDLAKNFFFGKSQKVSIVNLQKKCKCGKDLLFCTSIPSYKGIHFGCDICGARNLMKGGVFHCEACQYDLCKECNNETKIKCDACGKEELKWMTDIPQKEYDTYYWCDVCAEKFEIKDGVYHCAGCGKYDLCIKCKVDK